MKILRPLVLTFLFLACLSAPGFSQEKKWPFNDQTLRDAAFAALRLKLFQDGAFPPMPKGISLFLDGDEEPQDGWFMVTVRELHGEDSGADPNVAPALAHFYVRASDGRIEWYDVVEDQRRPWADFLRDRAQP